MFHKLKIALVADDLTRVCLGHECKIFNVTPFNHKFALRFFKPDFLLVESAWNGLRQSWRYKIASYEDFPERSNDALRSVVSYAKSLGIPCIFWNKEDDVHFKRFISSASFFDYIFTVDENSIPKYVALLGDKVRVNSLTFAVQPAIHAFTGIADRIRKANFVGSYNSGIHERRRHYQNMLFSASSNLGLVVFDRNSNRKGAQYRYPAMPYAEVRKSVGHTATAEIYKNYIASLNVNTVDDSNTMFSRRLVEIIACGGLAITTPAKSVDNLFKGYCHTVHSEDEARHVLDRLRFGYTRDDMEMIRSGAEHVLRRHTYKNFLETILDTVRPI